MRRRPLIIVLLVVALALGLWTAGWYVAGRQLIAAIDRWATARRAEGWQVAYGAPAIGGFPTKVSVLLTDPALAGAARGPGTIAWTWRAPSIRVEIVPWRFDRIVLRNHGENRVGLERDGAHLDGVLETDDARVRIEAGRPDDVGHYVIELAHPQLRVAQPPIGVTAREVGLDLRLHRTAPGDHLAVAAVLGVGVADLVTEALGRVAAAPVTANLHAELMGAIPPGPPDQSVPAWRDDGGTVELRRFYFTAGGVTLTANGTLAFDNQMRPMGAASATIRGYDAAIDRLTEIGTVNPRDAQLAKLLLSALATPGDNGERVLNVAITAQNGWLYVGPVRLARLDALRLK